MYSFLLKPQNTTIFNEGYSRMYSIKDIKLYIYRYLYQIYLTSYIKYAFLRRGQDINSLQDQKKRREGLRREELVVEKDDLQQPINNF